MKTRTSVLVGENDEDVLVHLLEGVYHEFDLMIIEFPIVKVLHIESHIRAVLGQKNCIQSQKQNKIQHTIVA